MIGVVLWFIIWLVTGVIALLILTPALVQMIQTVAVTMKPIAEKTKTIATNETLKNVTDQFIGSLDFQSTLLMELAKYAWLILLVSFFFGVFMLTRTWVEFQRGRLI